MAAAARADRATALAGAGAAGAEAATALGGRLLRQIFGPGPADGQLPEQLAGLIANPDDEKALAALEGQVHNVLHEDPELATAVATTLTVFYRQQIEAGNTQAMVDLGDLLRWRDDRDGARAAYQQAIDRGHAHALIDLAHLLRGDFGDAEGERAALQQAIESGDPDVAAEAMAALGDLLAFIQRDADAARAAFQRAIDSGHPVWGPAAMVGLAHLLRRQGDADGAGAAYQQAIDSGNADCAADASIHLGLLLDERGDVAGAKAAWQRVIDSGNADWAAPAFTELVNLLREQDDVDGLRAAHHAAAETGNPDAPYALDVIGQLLEGRGDTAGAHAAYQQAIEVGYEFAGELLERMSPPADPEDDPDDDAELADLPPQFHPRNAVRAGIDVLDHGLPALPDVLTRQMSVPIAHWKADGCAVVLFLMFSRHLGDVMPMVTQATFTREGGHWTAHQHWHGTGWSHDPIASPGDLRDLGGRPMVYGGQSWAPKPAPGHPAAIVTGRVAPEVKHMALIQDGHEDRRPLQSHFGAWVVCTQRSSPFQITALDENGTLLASIQPDPPDDLRSHPLSGTAHIPPPNSAQLGHRPPQ